MDEIKLSDRYINLLKRMKIIYRLFLKKHPEYISVQLEDTECKSFNVGSLPVNLKPIANIMNNTTNEAITHIIEFMDVKVLSQYVEKARCRIWDIQHTVRYKQIITEVLRSSYVGDQEKVCNSLQELRSYILDMIEPEWI